MNIEITESTAIQPIGEGWVNLSFLNRFIPIFFIPWSAATGVIYIHVI